MSILSKLDPDLQARVHALAMRAKWTPEQVIADALENGHSIEWQERFLDHVLQGKVEADRGEFASDDDVDCVFNRFRPV